jgi:hypothetical protein
MNKMIAKKGNDQCQLTCTKVFVIGFWNGVTLKACSYCFLVLTWNLMYRANNTTNVMFADIVWTKFDCMEIYFRHMKGDQLGELS